MARVVGDAFADPAHRELTDNLMKYIAHPSLCESTLKVCTTSDMLNAMLFDHMDFQNIAILAGSKVNNSW